METFVLTAMWIFLLVAAGAYSAAQKNIEAVLCLVAAAITYIAAYNSIWGSGV